MSIQAFVDRFHGGMSKSMTERNPTAVAIRDEVYQGYVEY
jgi:hypothetical protein